MLTTAAKFAAAMAWHAGKLAIAHTRKMSPRELKEEFARWEFHHMPIDGRCVVCLLVGASRAERCPGSPAQQRARAELLAGDVHLHAEPKR